MGKALAKRLGRAGHEIRLSFSRDEQKLREAAKELGVGFGLPVAFARRGGVSALAAPWQALQPALDALGDLSGKIIWGNATAAVSDLSTMLVGTTNSGGEEVENRAPGA